MQFNLKIITILLCLFISAPQLFAQARKAEFKIHDRGNLWETMKDDGTIGAPDPFNRIDTYPSMDWPGGPHNMPKDDQRSYSVGSGVWIGGRHADNSLFFTENGPFTFVDRGDFGEITEVENFVGSSDYDVNEAEEMITARWTTTENILCQRVSRVWSFPGLNNFIIIEYTFTNKNSAAVNEMYIGFPHLIRPNYQDFVVHNGWGDDFNRTDELVDYDSTRALLYAYDDTPSPDFVQDIGNYWAATDELRAPGYAGFAMFYADATTDGSPQPANVLYGQLLKNEQHLSLNNTNARELYGILSGADRTLQADPDDRITPFMLMSAGPYALQPEQSVRIVMAEAVNGITLEEALQGLDAQSSLPAGLDSLQNTIDRARTLYENDYKLTAVPPPSPSLELIAVPATQSIKLIWPPVEQNWINPLADSIKIAEYRIYRAERSFNGPFELLRPERRQIKPGRSNDRERWFNEDLNLWIYEDNTINLGVSYYYAITCLDSSGRESFRTNRNEKAIRAANLPAENTLNVTVFPNPFREVSGFLTSGEENSIVWSHLPETCKIRIYTSSGELVRTIGHDNPNSGEAVWDQLSDARQRTAPGIYFWTVESAVGNARGTLLIIK